MDSPPPVDEVLSNIHKLDAPAMDGTRASDQWFEAMPELKVLLQHLAKNYDCDYTQILPNVLTAANGCSTRMRVKMQPTDQGYQNTQAVRCFS